VNEQEAADRFSEQVDCLIQGEVPTSLSADQGMQELLSLATQLSQVDFQASPAGQAAFQSQLGAWFGSPGGTGTTGPNLGRWNMISGKLLVLIVSVLVTIATAVTTLVITVVVVVSGLISGPIPETPTPVPSATLAPTATTDPTLTLTVVPTEVVTPTATVSPTLPTAVDTIETITVAVTVEIRVEDLIHAYPPGGDDDDDDGHGRGDSGDHNRGHGNDSDHHDEDNPGRSHD